MSHCKHIAMIQQVRRLQKSKYSISANRKLFRNHEESITCAIRPDNTLEINCIGRRSRTDARGGNGMNSSGGNH